jgi:hypothetical protein
MKPTTLTLENLLAIFYAMVKIKPIDRSEYFNNYYSEIIERIIDKEQDLYIIERLKLKQSGNRQETDRDRQQFLGGTISS